MAPRSNALHLSVAFLTGSAVDTDCLESALRELIARHDGLRLRFAEVDGTPVQWLGGADGWRLERLSIAEEGTHALRDAAVAFHERSFELAANPPIRAAVLQGPSRAVIQIVLHHLACDWKSIGNLLWELSSLYEARSRGARASLPPAQSFVGYLRWLEGWRRSADADLERRYWREALRGLDRRLSLPKRAPDVSGVHPGGDLPFMLSAPVELAELRARLGTTTFCVVLAAYAAALHRLSGDRSIPIATSVLGRPSDYLEAIGCFMNEVVLVTRIDPTATFADLVLQATHTSLGALDHGQLSYFEFVPPEQPDDIFITLHANSPREDRSGLIAAATGFVGAPAEAQFGPLRVTGFPLASREVDDDLLFHFSETPQTIHCALEYSQLVFSERDVAQLTESITRALVVGGRRPETHLASLFD